MQLQVRWVPLFGMCLITASLVAALVMLLHQNVDHVRERERIAERDRAAVEAAAVAGRAAAQHEREVLAGESDDQVLAEADPAVRAAVARAIADHEWEHHQ